MSGSSLVNLQQRVAIIGSPPPVHAAASSLVLIGRMWTTCNPSLTPPPLSTPHLSPVPDQGHQRSQGGGGRGRCWSSPASCAPTEFSHGFDPSNMSAVLSHLMGHPSPERTPLSEPQSQRCPCLTTTELGRREGGGSPRRGDEA